MEFGFEQMSLIYLLTIVGTGGNESNITKQIGDIFQGSPTLCFILLERRVF